MAQLRGHARELAILAVVTDLLGEVGYERLTIDAVVARAKASKATVYARWPDKPSLVAAALNTRSQHLPRVVPGAGSLREDLLRFIGLCVQLAETESIGSFVSVLMAADDEPALAEAVRGTALAPRRQDCSDIAARAYARREISDTGLAAEIFDLVMGKILVRYVLERTPISVAEQASFVDHVLLPVLLTRSAEPSMQ